MATKYTLYFTDTDKSPFDLQSYTKNGPESPSDPTIIAGASSAATTLKLYGKGINEYGEAVFQDLIYMLENFADSTEPVFPIEGQMWYQMPTFAGSPVMSLPRLHAYDGSVWDGIIMANGSSAMQSGKELILGIDPTNPLGAVTLQMHDSHATLTNVHLTSDQNTFLDALNLPTLTGTEVNFMEGITSNVQAQFVAVQAQFVVIDGQLVAIQSQLDNDTVSRIANTSMADNINLTFFLGGEVLGLPATPSATAATSKEYVDTLVLSGSGGDGVLSAAEWIDTGVGTPVAGENTLKLTVSLPASPDVIFQMEGISRTNHVHDAVDVTINNTFDVSYGTNAQTAIEQAASEIELLKTGGVPPSATITVQRIFEVLTSPLIAGSSPLDTFTVQSHFVDDNRIALTINGVKQYVHTHSTQVITYDSIRESTTATGLDFTSAYEFDIDIDGVGPTTVTINAGSPLVDISTHGALITEINNQLQTLSIDAVFDFGSSFEEVFTTYSSGSSSTISITDPGGSPNLYLFDIDVSPDIIIAATFLSGTITAGSPLTVTPDDITIAGDVTANYPAGTTFTIKGSSDATYGSYDGAYKVHSNGAVFGGVNTVIPIASILNAAIPESLLPLYDPTGGSPNPAPAPSPFGDVYLSLLGGIDAVETAVNGIEGDYRETDSIGNPIAPNGFSNTVVFNYDILTGSSIESLLYV